MKRSRTLALCLFSFLLLQLLVADQAQGQQRTPGVLASNGVVLIANTIVDLKWDPSQYAGLGDFARWELRRGPSQTTMPVIASGTDTLTDFYRDTGLATGRTYYYRLDIVRCPGQCPPDIETSYTLFSDSVNTGFFQGTVHHSLVLQPGIYEVGLGGGVGTGGSVTVVDDKKLTIGSGVTVHYSGTIGIGGIHVKDARLEVDDAEMNSIAITFGDYYDRAVKGEGWVRNTEFMTGSISMHGQSVISIQGNEGDFGIYLDHEASGKADDNGFSGQVEVREQASLTFQHNILEGDVTVSGYGTPPDSSKAHALIANSVISNTVAGRGISVMYGAQATVIDNEILWNGFHGTEGSVVLDVSDEGSKLIAERNKIVGKIAAYWGAEIELRDNVLDGGGSAITVGCIFCGSSTQATGVIEQNTIQNAWGFDLWPGSTALNIAHNCIRGNDPGLTWMPAQTEQLDVTLNWWNHLDGPYHKTLNPGSNGDEIDIIASGGTLHFDPWDPDDRYCADVPPPPPLADVAGRVYVPGSVYSLSRVPVTLVRLGTELDQAVTDINGFYSFNRVPITDSLVISVALEYAATTPPIFRVLYEGLGGPAAFVTTRPFNTTAGGDLAMDIRFADVPELDPATGIRADRRDDVGMVYYHIHQAWRLLDEIVSQRLDYNLPLDIVTFSPLADVWWTGDMSNAPGVVPDPRINITEAGGASLITDGGRPDNREWHEFGHHTQADTSANLMPNDPTFGNRNHGGYYNVSTNDSYTEGFAEFFSMMVAWYIDADPRPELYHWLGSDDNFESNYLSWTIHPTHGIQSEEFAVAGLLLDLVDPADARDMTIMDDTTYADCVEMSLEELWTILETDWGHVFQSPVAAGQGFGYLFDVRQLYDLLRLQGVG